MSARRTRALVRPALTVMAAAALATSLAACAGEAPAVVPGGNASRGKELIGHYGCGTCHTIGGVESAEGKVGPNLEHFGEYRYIIGILPRTPANTARWVENARKYLPQGAMPNLGVTPAEARDIAAYLYSQ